MKLSRQLLAILTFAAVFFIVQTATAQIMRIGIGGSAQLHLEASSDENQNIPEQFHQDIEYPSIAKFFDNDTPFAVSVAVESSPLNGKKIFFSFIYEQSKLQNSFKNSEFILGQSLNLRTHVISGGYGRSTNENNTTFIAGFIGIAIKKYEGESSLDDLQLIYRYKVATALRVGGNLEFERIMNSSLSLAFGVTFDYGSVDRDEVEFYENGVKAARAIPDGDITIYDNTLALQLSLRYSFELGLW